jgi:hypothetical protein
MKPIFNHLPFEKLADLAEGRVPPEERVEALAHAAACPRCDAKLTELRRVVGLMRADESMDAPQELLASAVNMFRARRAAAPTKPSLVERIVAALSFDSLQMRPAYGVRSGQPAARQLLYSAGESDIDLRVAPSGDDWVVSGQVLGADCAGGEVELKGASGAARVTLNEQCEFRFPPRPSGTYSLRLRLGNTEVEVPELELKA